MTETARKWVAAWLFAGCAMVFFQVIVGGVTRLTESGLSITEWKPVKGIVPPLNETEWQQEFELYKNITQFKTINQDMALSEFKWIYFWEYFHRFWARFMGFAFIIPFSFFVWKKWLDKAFFKRIGILFLWGGLIGVYGWIMVRSGLTGMYVPPIHLSIHLLLALSLFAYLVWLAIYVQNRNKAALYQLSNSTKNLTILLTVLIFIQIVLGGILSGMRAGLAYPTWPLMLGEFFPSALVTEKVSWSGFFQYNATDFWGRTFIQFTHRITAYSIWVLSVYMVFAEAKKSSWNQLPIGIKSLLLTVTLQAAIGIITVLNCTGKIPVFWGVAHQAGAMILLANVSLLWYYRKP